MFHYNSYTYYKAYIIKITKKKKDEDNCIYVYLIGFKSFFFYYNSFDIHVFNKIQQPKQKKCLLIRNHFEIKVHASIHTGETFYTQQLCNRLLTFNIILNLCNNSITMQYYLVTFDISIAFIKIFESQIRMRYIIYPGK